jgi:hypothetical protein
MFATLKAGAEVVQFHWQTRREHKKKGGGGGWGLRERKEVANKGSAQGRSKGKSQRRKIGWFRGGVVAVLGASECGVSGWGLVNH